MGWGCIVFCSNSTKPQQHPFSELVFDELSEADESGQSCRAVVSTAVA